MSRSAANATSLIKERHKTSAFRNVEDSWKEQHPPKSARDEPGFGMFPTGLTPTFPGHTEIPNGELSPNSFCPVDSNKSPGESPLLQHAGSQHLGMILNDFRKTSPLKHQ